MAVLTERRKHTRFEVPCRLQIEHPDGEDVRARTVNVSNGGFYFVADRAPPVGRAYRFRLAVPRETPNTFFLQRFAAMGRVVRHDRNPGGSATGVAVAFNKPLALDLP